MNIMMTSQLAAVPGMSAGTNLIDLISGLGTAIAAVVAAGSLATTLVLYRRQLRKTKASDARDRVAKLAYLLEELDVAIERNFFRNVSQTDRRDAYFNELVSRAIQLRGAIPEEDFKENFEKEFDSFVKEATDAVQGRMLSARDHPQYQRVLGLIRQIREECFAVRHTFPALYRLIRVYFRHIENMLDTMDENLGRVFLVCLSGALELESSEEKSSEFVLALVESLSAAIHQASIIGGGQQGIDSIKAMYNLILPLYSNDNDRSIISLSKRELALKIPPHSEIDTLSGELLAVQAYYIAELGKAEAVKFAQLVDSFKHKPTKHEIADKFFAANDEETEG